MNIPVKVKREIESAIKDAIRARGMGKEADHIAKSSKETLLPLLAAYDLKKYSMEGVGEASMRVSAGSSINADKLREILLLHGATPEVVDAVIEESSVSWSKEYVEVKIWT